MGKVYTGLDQRLTQFILAQPVFFVATAPSGDSGHVNVSPKGYRDTFAILGPTSVAYLDLSGSGAETIAHLRQNGRITIMFCSFTETPKILRLQGTGRVVLPGQPDWPGLAGHFPTAQERVAAHGNGPNGDGANGNGANGNGANGDGPAVLDGRRAIIVAELDRIADSCGYSVPLMDLREERDLLTQWTSRKSADQLDDYRAQRNAVSIDGLPAIG
jgi:Pyridoxamine 5'-phosphate oxidase